MRTLRLIPIALAGIAILGSGCAKTDHQEASDTALQNARPSGPQNPVNNSVGQTDNYNARTSSTDTGAALGSTNDSIRRGGPPVSKHPSTQP